MKKVVWLVLCILLLALGSFSQTILQNKKLPKDLQISAEITGTVQFATYYKHSIAANGFVSMEYTSRGLPATRDLLSVLVPLGQNPKKVEVPKLPKKKEKLSKDQLKELIRAFESSGFFSMNDSYYGDPSVINGTCVNHADAKALSITANGKTKSVYFFLGCSYGDGHELKNFLSLVEKIHGMISTVKVREVG